MPFTIQSQGWIILIQRSTIDQLKVELVNPPDIQKSTVSPEKYSPHARFSTPISGVSPRSDHHLHLLLAIENFPAALGLYGDGFQIWWWPEKNICMSVFIIHIYICTYVHYRVYIITVYIYICIHNVIEKMTVSHEMVYPISHSQIEGTLIIKEPRQSLPGWCRVDRNHLRELCVKI